MINLGSTDYPMLPTKFQGVRGWSGGAMVLGKLPVPGRPTIWITVRQGPTALAVGAGVGVVLTFLLSSMLSFPLSPSLWEAARHRLKYCLKGPLNPKQANNQPIQDVRSTGEDYFEPKHIYHIWAWRNIAMWLNHLKKSHTLCPWMHQRNLGYTLPCYFLGDM